MIAKEWLDQQNELVVEFYSESAIYCQRGIRAIYFNAQEFLDGSCSMGIGFVENGISILGLEAEYIDDDFSKKLLVNWLVHQVSHQDLMSMASGIEKNDIYEAYLRGEGAMIEFHWREIKDRIWSEREFRGNAYAESMTELLNSCSASSVLGKCIPFISLGRLCLSRTLVGQPIEFNCLCIYSEPEKTVVARYENTSPVAFSNVADAVKYMESIHQQ